jgi:hypothetical protein
MAEAGLLLSSIFLRKVAHVLGDLSVDVQIQLAFHAVVSPSA